MGGERTWVGAAGPIGAGSQVSREDPKYLRRIPSISGRTQVSQEAFPGPTNGPRGGRGEDPGIQVVLTLLQPTYVNGPQAFGGWGWGGDRGGLTLLQGGSSRPGFPPLPPTPKLDPVVRTGWCHPYLFNCFLRGGVGGGEGQMPGSPDAWVPGGWGLGWGGEREPPKTGVPWER